MLVAVAREGDHVAYCPLGEDGSPVGERGAVGVDEFAAFAASCERERPRWLWDDTREWASLLLRDGVRVERCWDLRLAGGILRAAPATAEAMGLSPEWLDPVMVSAHSIRMWWAEGGEAGDQGGRPVASPTAQLAEPLFGGAPVAGLADICAEAHRQFDAVAGLARPRLLIAADCTGALIAAEMRHAGLPWSLAEHDRLLADMLGPRPRFGARPTILQELADQVIDALGVGTFNLDSPQAVLASLRRAGLDVSSTRKWELRKIDHAAIAPLLQYKKLARLNSANGWAWAEQWAPDGRFRPEYQVAGVVTGRWATSGGGALQLPRELHPAVVADPGWTFVIADAAQLEPRILAGLARDEAMAKAGRGQDIYAGIEKAGGLASRAEAKIAMLSVMYGGQGSGMLPRLRRAFPTSLALVEHAASVGEAGGQVATHLGRTSPPPGATWDRLRAAAGEGPQAEAAAREFSRGWGRFTRNFVVQGTAAEWAEIWMATIRRELAVLAAESGPAEVKGLAPAPFDSVPHLVFFLHDEIIVHTPAETAAAVQGVVERAAGAAGEMLFGDFPVEFPLKIRVSDTYG